MAKIAVIETGGKQYLVENDAVLYIEKIEGEKDGKVSFDKVLLTDDGTSTNVGAPYLSGVAVKGEIIEEGREKKVVVIKYRQKSRYFKKKGHRQPYTKVKISL
mgnify:CR=1 FL=1